MSMPRIIISGGGTGGHIFPAIAIADAIKQKAPDAEILFVGANGRMEMERVPKAGYEIMGLDVVGFQRKLTLKNLLFPFKLAKSMWQAVQIVRSFNPDIAVGVGGYASGPVLRIANSFGVKTVLQEQNSYAGVTNKLLAKAASLICVAYDKMDRFFPASKIIFTGNPIRKDLAHGTMSVTDARLNLGLNPDKKTILVFGGSLGAKTINEAVAHHAETIIADTNVQWYWQVGGGYFDQYKDHKLAQAPNVKVVAFIEDMKSAYFASDLVVCRAGALTISELAVMGKASILVPSPNVAEDHQTVNAMSLVNKEAAMMLKDVEIKNNLISDVKKLMSDDNMRQRFATNIKYFARNDAAEVIADRVLTLING
jgi:UDP-N-acetylglucosamine--N-acetylmuramyl-(pentapeptide) pyrophosphoryl-undecaprenol N-acetylglucosamine transferase